MDVLVNAAASADGKLSTRERDQVAISGPEDFDRVDRLRADSDAVMVGIGTALADDPSLTIEDGKRRRRRRERGESSNPARVVADSRCRLPTEARLLDDRARTVVLASEAAPRESVSRLEATGAEVLCHGADRVDLGAALGALEERGVDRLMVEGGGELLFSLFEEGLVDVLSVFVGPCVLGGRDAPTLVDGEGFVGTFPRLELEDAERLDGGILLRWTLSGE